MKGLNQRIGGWGEARVEQILREKGLGFVARNYRTPYGEIDLIFRDGAGLVFVEVKTRRGRSYGEPEEAVTKTKQQHLRKAIEHYLTETALSGVDWRIDVAALVRQVDGSVDMQYFENAVTGE